MSNIVLRSILAATDLAEGSDEVVRSAARLAEATGAQLHVLHAFDPVSSPAPEAEQAAPVPGFPQRVEHVERALDEQILRAVGSSAPPASRRVRIFNAPGAIEEYAEDVSAELVVLGRSQRGGLEARALGTTADQVVRKAKVPCLVLSSPLALPLRSVLVAHDLSAPASAALDAGLRLAAAVEDPSSPARIRVLHVGWPVDKADHPTIERETLHPELRSDIERALRRAGGLSAREIEATVAWAADPVEGILTDAQGWGAELVVVGTQGAGGLKRFLVGSAASAVARRARVPVLIVPPPPED